MVELTDIQGIGPATAEALQENGIDSVEDLSESDAQTLTEVENITEKNAQMFIVRAQDILGENEAEVEEEDMPEEDDVAEDITADLFPDNSSDDSSSSDEDEEESQDTTDDSAEEDDGLFDVTFGVNDRQFDLLMQSLVEEYVRQQRRNIERAEHADTLLGYVRTLGGGGEFSERLSRGELNTLYSAVRRTRRSLQGRNRIDLMHEMREVVDQVSEAREALF